MTDIDALQKRVDSLCREIDDAVAKATRHKVTVEHFDDNGDNGDDDYDDVSNLSLSADDDSENDGDNGDNPGNDLDDDDDDEDNGDVAKFSNTYFQNTRSVADRPGSLEFTSHPERRATIASATQPATRHKFDSRVDFVKDRDGITKQIALQRARLEFPADYEDYQKFNAGTSSSEQYARRGGWGNNLGKSAPNSFEAMVEAEMRKCGVTAEVAGQRVLQAYGSNALRSRAMTKRIARAEDAEDQLIKGAEDLWASDPNIDRCSALRETRLNNPRLHKVLTRG